MYRYCHRTYTETCRKNESASAGKLNISASYSSNDELAVLYNQFNLMMQKIQTLLNDIYEEQNAKQKMEIRLLQSQINPHFLYNTLNTIKSLIELDMNDTAVKAVSAMSSFYRNSLSKGQFIIPLRQELLLTEQYLYIQNLRYMDFVDYEITYEPSWEDHGAEIPKLTIQPVVENIFVHGLTSQMCHIHLNVSIRMVPSVFLFLIMVPVSRRKNLPNLTVLSETSKLPDILSGFQVSTTGLLFSTVRITDSPSKVHLKREPL